MARTGTETQRFGTLRLLPIALAAEATRDRRLSTAARADDRLPGPVLLPPADPGCAAALGVDRDRAGRLMRPLALGWTVIRQRAVVSGSAMAVRGLLLLLPAALAARWTPEHASKR